LEFVLSALFGTSRYTLGTAYWNRFQWPMAAAMLTVLQATRNAKTPRAETTFGGSIATTIPGPK
jgi:hypothetical protein